MTMKKTLSAVLALCMVLMLLPVAVGAQAVDEHKHPMCGSECVAGSHSGAPGHEDVTWIKLTQADFGDYVAYNKGTERFELFSGNYYLGEDITLHDWISDVNDYKSGYLYIAGAGDYNICLNGHTLSGKGDKQVIVMNSANKVLNICDCGGGGKITGGMAAAAV